MKEGSSIGVLHSPESPTARLNWPWDHYEDETNPIDGQKGLRKRGHQPYPAAMYKLTNRNPLRFDYEEANDDSERERAEARGFVYGGQGMAVDAYDKQQTEIAELAANRAYSDRKMSPEAQREAADMDENVARHLPVIPELPRPPRAAKKD